MPALVYIPNLNPALWSVLDRCRIPEGNLTGSSTIFPFSSRSRSDYPSSMVIILYPASYKPRDFIRLAVDLTLFSSTLVIIAFHVFYPIGGVLVFSNFES